MSILNKFESFSEIKRRVSNIDENLLPRWYYSIQRELRRDSERPVLSILLIYGLRRSGKTYALYKLLYNAEANYDWVGYYTNALNGPLSQEIENDPDMLLSEIFSEGFDMRPLLVFDDILSMSEDTIKSFLEALTKNAPKGLDAIIILSGSAQPGIYEIIQTVKRMYSASPYISLKNLASPFSSALTVDFMSALRRLRRVYNIRSFPLIQGNLSAGFYRVTFRKYLAFASFMNYLTRHEVVQAESAFDAVIRSFRNASATAIHRAYKEFILSFGTFPEVLIDPENPQKETLVEFFVEYMKQLPSEEYDLLGELSEKLFQPVSNITSTHGKEVVRSLLSRGIILPLWITKGRVYDILPRLKETRADMTFIPVPVDYAVLEALQETFGVHTSSEYYDLMPLVTNILRHLSSDPKTSASYEYVHTLYLTPIFYDEISNMPVIRFELSAPPHNGEIIIMLLREGNLSIDLREMDKGAVWNIIERTRPKFEAAARYGIKYASTPIIVVERNLEVFDYVRMSLDVSEEEILNLQRSRKGIATYSPPPKHIDGRGVRFTSLRSILAALLPSVYSGRSKGST